MQTRQQLQGSLTSLSQTLTQRADDAARDHDIFTKWFGTKMACSATLGRANDWSALPPQHAAYTSPLGDTTRATNEIAIVHLKDAWLAALNDADGAISAIADLLDKPPV